MPDLSNFLRLFVPWLPNRKYAPVPASRQLVSEGDHIPLHCPRCESPQPATEKLSSARTRTSRKCQNCGAGDDSPV